VSENCVTGQASYNLKLKLENYLQV